MIPTMLASIASKHLSQAISKQIKARTDSNIQKQQFQGLKNIANNSPEPNKSNTFCTSAQSTMALFYANNRTMQSPLPYFNPIVNR
jgi:hypothetical protein